MVAGYEYYFLTLEDDHMVVGTDGEALPNISRLYERKSWIKRNEKILVEHPDLL